MSDHTRESSVTTPVNSDRTTIKNGAGHFVRMRFPKTVTV
jgi:hypothetical protein